MATRDKQEQQRLFVQQHQRLVQEQQQQLQLQQASRESETIYQVELNTPAVRGLVEQVQGNRIVITKIAAAVWVDLGVEVGS